MSQACRQASMAASVRVLSDNSGDARLGTGKKAEAEEGEEKEEEGRELP